MIIPSIKYYFYILPILLVAACRQQETNSTEKTIDKKQEVVNDTLQYHVDSIRWMTPEQFTPISFLDAVVNKTNQDTILNLISMMDEFPLDWVKQTDIDTLMTLINSTKKCRCFLNPLSSYIPTNESADMGGYAILFINSFRQKSKISLGLFSCPKTNKQSIKEINQWWANYKHIK